MWNNHTALWSNAPYNVFYIMGMLRLLSKDDLWGYFGVGFKKTASVHIQKLVQTHGFNLQNFMILHTHY